jgi:hypothetical protein
MIRFLVEAYRFGIAIFMVVVIFGCIVLASNGSAGLMWALGLLAISIMSLGISATLLSINDHLAAMRPPEVAAAPDQSQRDEAKFFGAAGIAIALFALLAVAILYFTGELTERGDGLGQNTAEQSEIVTHPTLNQTELSKLSNQADENGCVPRMAAEVGLTCDN